jgi:hypothetical protein
MVYFTAAAICSIHKAPGGGHIERLKLVRRKNFAVVFGVGNVLKFGEISRRTSSLIARGRRDSGQLRCHILIRANICGRQYLRTLSIRANKRKDGTIPGKSLEIPQDLAKQIG